MLRFHCVFQLVFRDWHARIRDVAAKLLQEIVVKAGSPFFGHQEMSWGLTVKSPPMKFTASQKEIIKNAMCC